jgi:NDP-sugar pyrophosphorylase family protein
VRAFVGDGAQFGLRVAYVDEGPTLRGTGGALRLADDLGVLADSFLVTYGDSYLPFDYAAPLDMLRADASLSSVMAVFHNQRQWDASNVKLTADGRRVASYEKGTSDPSYEHIDYGATALRRSCLARVPTDGAYGLDRLQHALAAEGTMGACVAAERFFEVGSPEGLATLEAYLAEGARSVTGAMKAPSR